jgi:FkbM family methyltransferase
LTEISFFEKIGAHVRYWIDFFQMISNVRKTFQNPIEVLSKLFKNDFPVNAILKNNTKIQLKSFSAAYFISNIPKNMEVNYDIEKDYVTLLIINESKQKKIIFHGGLDNGDIVNTFFKKDYARILVNKKTVLDIGANIGDTAIYYIINGAKKVIGIEPFPKNFEYAQKNININNLSNEIEILQAGCSSKNEVIKIDPEYKSNIESQIKNFKNGIDIPMLTIENIINKFQIPKNSILKIDCEGCEYDIIENVSIENISHFSSIQIEYHFGYQGLKRKLEQFGYTVIVTKPHATNVILSIYNLFKSKNLEMNQKIGYTGFIFAMKQDESDKK